MSDAAKILLIEDDPGIVMTLRRLLTEEGRKVVVETRGDAGLARALGEEFDAVVTDWKLPNLTSWKSSANSTRPSRVCRSFS